MCIIWKFKSKNVMILASGGIVNLDDLISNMSDDTFRHLGIKG